VKKRIVVLATAAVVLALTASSAWGQGETSYPAKETVLVIVDV
jgi:hypothetical protein